MKYSKLPLPLLLAAALLAGGCATNAPLSTDLGQSEIPSGKQTCGSFFVYDMCMEDTAGDGWVDYLYFADDNQIFMYRAGASLPADKPLHRCAIPMREDVLTYSSRLLYSEDLSLLEEMDVKRHLLLSYISAKGDVDGCYGGDSRTAANDTAGGDFVRDDFDWGED